MTTWFVLLLARVFISVVLMIVGVYISENFWHRLKGSHILIWYGIRILSMFLLICVYNQIPSDVIGWYQHAHWIIDNKAIPGIDFRTPYYIGFNYVIALSVWIYDSPMAIALSFALIELIGVFAWKGAMQIIWGEKVGNKTIILYLTSPIFFANSWLAAQDETIALCTMGLFLLIIAQKKSIFKGLALLACSVMFSKILTVFYIVPFSLMRKFRFVAALIFGLVLCVSIFWLVGINPFDFSFAHELGVESKNIDSIMRICTSGNIWYLMPSSTLKMALPICTLGLGVIYFMFFGVFSEGWYSRARIEGMIMLLCSSFVVFCLLYPMTWGSYCIPIVIPLFLIFHFGGRLSSRVFRVTVFLWVLIMAWKDFFKCGIASLPSPMATGMVVTITVGAILVNALLLCLIILKYKSYGLMNRKKIKNGIENILSVNAW